jgi:murein DD-endopeptidase MepM/ murein hydrolase activator NlpD
MRRIALALCLASLACDSGGSSSAESGRASTPSAAETSEAAESSPSAEASAATPDGVSPAGSAAAAPGAVAADEPPKADPSRLKLDGKGVQGGLMRAQVDKGTKGVKFPGHRVVISPEGKFLIGFYRNAPPKETLTITFPDGAVLEKVFEIEQRTFEDDRIDNLPEHFVKLDAETQRKLTAANARIAVERRKFSDRTDYEGGFIWPVRGKVTSRYGQKRFLNGTDGGIHWGVDIAVPVGTPVKAPAGGVVLFIERDVPLAGHTMVVDHGHGLTSTFIHLAGFTKKVGDEVKQGDVIATVGMTGRTNGPHLDWRMNLFEDYRLDPELLVAPMDAK